MLKNRKPHNPTPAQPIIHQHSTYHRGGTAFLFLSLVNSSSCQARKQLSAPLPPHPRYSQSPSLEHSHSRVPLPPPAGLPFPVPTSPFLLQQSRSLLALSYLEVCFKEPAFLKTARAHLLQGRSKIYCMALRPPAASPTSGIQLTFRASRLCRVPLPVNSDF